MSLPEKLWIPWGIMPSGRPRNGGGAALIAARIEISRQVFVARASPAAIKNPSFAVVER
jgi:hypothetical protein